VAAIAAAATVVVADGNASLGRSRTRPSSGTAYERSPPEVWRLQLQLPV
jgi:hypothetical protein